MEGVMYKKVMNVLVLSLLLVSYNGHGYFYQLRVVRKIDKQTKKQQLIICCGDYHVKKHPANQEQRMYLESVFKKCGGCKSHLIVEDVSSVNNKSMIGGKVGVNCCKGVLGQLASFALKVGLCVDNVEYRYCRVIGIGPLLQSAGCQPAALRSCTAITTLALYNEVIDEIEKIKKYDDGKYLNALYKKTVMAVYAALIKIGLKNSSTIADYCAQFSQKNYRKELEQICIFDSALLDMKILHAIVTCPKDIIFVVAGGSHIDHVVDMLQRIGYESLFATPRGYSHPVDITLINTFIPQ
jgi:hypothetical protein